MAYCFGLVCLRLAICKQWFAIFQQVTEPCRLLTMHVTRILTRHVLYAHPCEHVRMYTHTHILTTHTHNTAPSLDEALDAAGEPQSRVLDYTLDPLNIDRYACMFATAIRHTHQNSDY
jgi:hypothetical protein